MGQPRRYGCVVCRRPLNRYVDSGAVVDFRHPLHLGRVDHHPVPRPVEQIPGGVIEACDLCSVEDTNAWVFHSADITLVADGPHARWANNYGTRWAACPVCAALASARDLDRLHAHALATAGLPRHDVAAATTRKMMAATLAALQPGRTFILDGRTGTPPALPPQLLPKLRDRLAVLLGKDNVLPALPDAPVRRQIAAGLPLSRLYTIDAAYTDMAVAAATGLRQASIAALDVPAPFGLLTFAHPVDTDATIAISWASDADTIHLTRYRALGTTITGTQLQKLREQAGWLVPTGVTTLHPDHGVDGGHPAAVPLAAWLLITHRLTETVPVPVDPPIRKAYARAGRPTPEVRIVQLRPRHRPTPPGNPTETTQPAPGRRRESDHRWWVSAYVRDQAHGPGRTLRKPILVLPFVNGPRGKPVKASTTVRLLGHPKPRPQPPPESTEDSTP